MTKSVCALRLGEGDAILHAVKRSGRRGPRTHLPGYLTHRVKGLDPDRDLAEHPGTRRGVPSPQKWATICRDNYPVRSDLRMQPQAYERRRLDM